MGSRAVLVKRPKFKSIWNKCLIRWNSWNLMLIVKIKNLYKRCFFDRIVILSQKFSYKYWQNIYFLLQSVNQQIRRHIFILSFIKQWNRILLENGFFFIIPVLPLSANRARSTARYFWYAVPAIVNGILERVKEYRREIVGEMKLEKKVEIISKGEFSIVGWHYSITLS